MEQDKTKNPHKEGTKEWLKFEYLYQYSKARKLAMPSVCAGILEKIGVLMKVDREIENKEVAHFHNDIKAFEEFEENEDKEKIN